MNEASKQVEAEQIAKSIFKSLRGITCNCNADNFPSSTGSSEDVIWNNKIVSLTEENYRVACSMLVSENFSFFMWEHHPQFTKEALSTVFEICNCTRDLDTIGGANARTLTSSSFFEIPFLRGSLTI